MIKKLFLLLIVAMLNVVAWAEPAFEITPIKKTDGKSYFNYDTSVEPHVHYGHAGSSAFTEPTVVIKDGSEDITNRYILTYKIGSNEPAIVNGVRKSTDPTTGSSVECNYGQVSLGRAGSITINVTATRREGYEASEAPDVSMGSYDIRIDALEADYNIVPEFHTTERFEYDYEVILNTLYSNNSWSAAKTILPHYSVTSTYGGADIDITDHFDIGIVYTPIGGGTSRITLAADKSYLEFAIVYETTITGSKEGTLTYTFTPKSEYAGYYETVVKKVYVGLNEISSAPAEKWNLVATLDNTSFFQENITTRDGLPQINVYKYGTNDSGTKQNDTYSSPVPTLSYNGVIYPQCATKGGGGYGDFRMVYIVESDVSNHDDCQYVPFSTDESVIHAGGEGQPTGLSIDTNTFQMGAGGGGVIFNTGLIKVKGYAVLGSDDWYGAPLKACFNQLGTVRDPLSNEVCPYYATVEFYINVMKRKPEVIISPNPAGLKFGVGDVITMNDRFEVYGYTDGKDSNGKEGLLVYDINNPKWKAQYGDDIEIDKLSYSFFISRTYKDTKISISDWPYEVDETNWNTKGGDKYSYKWTYPTPHTSTEEIEIAIGDKIKVGDDLVEITSGNIDYYKTGAGNHRYLDAGDEEGGIMYNTMKEWGNENWTMTFMDDGEYDIPYLLRQYNHIRWDNSDLQLYHYSVDDKISAELQLSYYYTVARKGQGDDFDEPTAKVVLSSFEDIDVTRDFDITYSMDGVIAEEETVEYKGETGWTKYTDTATGTILYTKGDREEVEIGDTNVGQVVIKATATVKDDVTKSYGSVATKEYIINIVDPASMARWEIISSTKSAGCTQPETSARFTEISKAHGHMHFLPKTSYVDGRDAGEFYGGTVITGVPGVSMTIGSEPSDHDATADWLAIVPVVGTGKCCQHETATVVVKPIAPLVLDENDELPVSGAYYKFVPTVNGFLYVDAKFTQDHRHVLIAQGTKEKEIYTPTMEDVFGYEFQTPLLAGETYYLYDMTNGVDLNLHGFWFTPAFLKGTETRATWEEPYSGTTFLNSLSNGVPKLLKGSDEYVDFTVVDYGSNIESPKTSVDYLTIGLHNGKLKPKVITVKGSDIFYLKVNAAVKSSLGVGYSDCTKNPYYYVRIIDIPKYQVVKVVDAMPGIPSATKVSTTNIKTDITMTFGALGEPNDARTAFESNPWDFKGDDEKVKPHKSGGAYGIADRIGNPNTYCDDETYNRTLDGFLSFYCAGRDAYDENIKLPLLSDNNNSYSYATGTDYESDGSFNRYNTTYRLPAHGTFLKFEPRESGTLMVYLVQNGSCDYYDGRDASKDYLVKWRPLYITDETGKPVTMVNSFDNISEYLPSAEDMVNAGSYTEGLSRCSKNEEAVKSYGSDKMDGCTFDWSEFMGTMADRQSLMAAWPNTGQPESIIRLENGGFVLPHKAYVRYTFEVKAGKTYFVFQHKSKPEFGGFAFVPEGFPDKSKYTYDSTPASYKFNSENQEKNWSGTAATSEVTYATGTHTTYDAADPIKGAQSHITDKSVLSGSDYQEPAGRDINFTWDKTDTRFTSDKENLVVTINDRRNSELTSSAAAYADNKGKIKPRIFSAGVWESICLPFSVSEQEMTRVFGPNYLLVTCEGLYEDTDNLLFVRHANRYIEAGRPYLIKPTQNGVFSFRNVTIEGGQNISTYGGSVNKLPNPARFNLGVNDNEFVFKGTYMRETVPAGSYFVYSDNAHAKDEGALYKYGSNVKIGGYRAYFQKQTANPDAVLPVAMNISDIMFIEESGEVTEVIAVSEDGTVNSLPKNAGVYTVDGQKVSDSTLDLKTLPSGLYIINGKKYIK